MPLHRPLLLVAAALAGVALVVPAAGAGSRDVQAVRAAAVRYTRASMSGSPQTCQLMMKRAQVAMVSVASMLTKTKLSSCPAAVKAIDKLNASQFPNRQAYLRSGEASIKAVGIGKVILHGSRATLNYTVKQGFVEVSSSMNFVRVQGDWLIYG